MIGEFRYYKHIEVINQSGVRPITDSEIKSLPLDERVQAIEVTKGDGFRRVKLFDSVKPFGSKLLKVIDI